MKTHHLFSLLIAGSLLYAEENWGRFPPPPDSSYLAEIEVIEVPAGTPQKLLAEQSWPDLLNKGISETEAAKIVAKALQGGDGSILGKERIKLTSRKKTTVAVGESSSTAGKGAIAHDLVMMDLTPVSDSGSLALFLRVKKNPGQHETFREPDLAGAYLFHPGYAESMVISCGAGNPQREVLIHIATRPGGKTAEKAQHLTLGDLKLDRASLAESIETLRSKSVELDPRKEGINIISFPDLLPGSGEISLELKNVPLSEALRYTTELAGLKARYGPFAVLIGQFDLERNMEQMTLELRAPDDAGLHKKLENVQFWLASLGVMFPEGAFAKFDREKGILTVRAVWDELEMVEAILIAFGGSQAHPPRITKAWQQAQAIILPEIDMRGLNVREAVDFLQKSVRANVRSSVTPPRIELRLSANQEFPPIILQLREVPLSETLRLVASKAHLSLLLDDDALVLESYFYGKGD